MSQIWKKDNMNNGLFFYLGDFFWPYLYKAGWFMQPDTLHIQKEKKKTPRTPRSLLALLCSQLRSAPNISLKDLQVYLRGHIIALECRVLE